MSRFRLGRDSVNFLVHLLSYELAINTLPSPWALTNRPEIPGEFTEISNLSSWEDDNCWLRILQWLLGLNLKYRSKQNTDKWTSWPSTDQNSRDLPQTTTAAETLQNKGLNETYNSSARVINLCTFPGQLMQNKQVHKTHLCTSLKVVMKGSQKLKPSPTSLPTKLCPTPNGPQNLTPPPIVNYGSLKHKHW